MWKKAEPLPMTEEQRRTLEAWDRARTTPQRTVLRARVCLLAAQGWSNGSIAKELRVSRPTVILWRQRFAAQGSEGISVDAPHGSSPQALPADKVKEIVEATLHTTPKDATHWSVRTMAKAQGVGKSTVQRIWDAHGLQPHRMETFKLSKDKRFVEKLTDVVGLYVNPPEKAVVLCVDEKSQIQALDRTQPGLPMKKGRAGTMTHDYKRHGTTTLFAGLDVKTGEVIGECLPKHRAREFIVFLKKIDRLVAKSRDVHLVLDNYATHKTAEVKAWLDKHPRFKLHFTPTSASWLNLVERLFAEVTRQRIRRGVFTSVDELKAAIDAWVNAWNVDPKPFVWTAKAGAIIAKHARAKKTLATVSGGCK